MSKPIEEIPYDHEKVHASIQEIRSRTPKCPITQDLLDQQKKLLNGFSATPLELGGVGGWRGFELEEVMAELGITRIDVWRYFGEV